MVSHDTFCSCNMFVWASKRYWAHGICVLNCRQKHKISVKLFLGDEDKLNFIFYPPLLDKSLKPKTTLQGMEINLLHIIHWYAFTPNVIILSGNSNTSRLTFRLNPLYMLSRYINKYGYLYDFLLFVQHVFS